MPSTFFLKHASACRECKRQLAVGSRAYKGPGQGAGVRCATCGPFPLPEGGPVTVLRPGRARGAVDSATKPIMTKAEARSIALGRQMGTPSPSQQRAIAKRQKDRKRRATRKRQRQREAAAALDVQAAAEKLAEHFGSRR